MGGVWSSRGDMGTTRLEPPSRRRSPSAACSETALQKPLRYTTHGERRSLRLRAPSPVLLRASTELPRGSPRPVQPEAQAPGSQSGTQTVSFDEFCGLVLATGLEDDVADGRADLDAVGGGEHARRDGVFDDPSRPVISAESSTNRSVASGRVCRGDRRTTRCLRPHRAAAPQQHLRRDRRAEPTRPGRQGLLQPRRTAAARRRSASGEPPSRSVRSTASASPDSALTLHSGTGRTF
jgi:hypothetical protein